MPGKAPGLSHVGTMAPSGRTERPCRMQSGRVLVSGLARGAHGPDGSERQPGDARRILDERLARGEIDAEEYGRLREILDGGTGRSPAGTAGAR